MFGAFFFFTRKKSNYWGMIKQYSHNTYYIAMKDNCMNQEDIQKDLYKKDQTKDKAHETVSTMTKTM